MLQTKITEKVHVHNSSINRIALKMSDMCMHIRVYIMCTCVYPSDTALFITLLTLH